MLSNSINRWAASISTVAVTVVGAFSYANSPAIAAPACTPGTALEGVPIPGPSGGEPATTTDIRTRAQNAVSAVSNPDVILRRYNAQTSGSINTYELRGRQLSTSSTAVPGFLCQAEADVVVDDLTTPAVVGIEEIEVELATVAELPAVVRNRLNSVLPSTRFTPYFIELSRRYSPPEPYRNVTPVNADSVVYEIEGVCRQTFSTSANGVSISCVIGQDAEVQFNNDSTGTVRDFDLITS